MQYGHPSKVIYLPLIVLNLIIQLDNDFLLGFDHSIHNDYKLQQ